MKAQEDCELIYIGEDKPKSVLLKVRVAPKMLELIDQHVKVNGIKSRSFFVRRVLNYALNLSLEDFLECIKPFAKHQPQKRKPHD